MGVQLFGTTEAVVGGITCTSVQRISIDTLTKDLHSVDFSLRVVL